MQIRKVVIVGGGTAGWMTAAALSKSLGLQNYDITLIESDEIGTVGVGEATIPAIKMFNEVLGIDEDTFVRETQATFKLGIEFVDWRKPGSTYFHPFGVYGIDMDGISFLHYWMRLVRMGGNPDSGLYNMETVAARAHKFGRTKPDGSHMPAVNYAFQFDAGLYAGFLRGFSEKLGVVRQEGRITQAYQNPENGNIISVELADGTIVQGDLFIDCSGFRALLIGETMGVPFEDWSQWLPVNRAIAVPCERVEDPLPFTRCTAREAGWQWRIPLQHRTGNGYVFCEDFISEDEATVKLLTRLDGKALAEPRVLKFVTGHRKTYWHKNCVAIGLSSGFLEPLESTSIHLTQACITRLLSYFPRHGFNQNVINSFNTQMDELYSGIRDFIIAHYKVTERDDTPFWRHCRQMEIPDSLVARLDIFASEGNAMVNPGELFRESSWFAVLSGQGLMPHHYHPVADNVAEGQFKLRLAQIRTGIQDRLNSLPTHAQFIADHCAAGAVKYLSMKM